MMVLLVLAALFFYAFLGTLIVWLAFGTLRGMGLACLVL